MIAERALSPNEAEFEFYNQNLNGSLQMQLCLRISGPLSYEILQRALRLLQSEHRLLQARIAGSNGDGLHYEVDDALEIPIRLVPRESGGDQARQWRDVIQEELNSALDTGSGLMRVAYIPAGEGADSLHDVIIKAHHGIMDAASMMHVYGRLLEYCGMLAEGQNPGQPRTPRSISPPTTELLPLRGLALRWRLFRFMTYMMWSMITKKPKPMPIVDFAPVDQQQSSFVDVRLPAGLLARLVERARNEGSSVTAALAAAMLRGTRRLMAGDEAM
ncbi:MAG: condensation domain-containing protein, partial [Leptospirales bacterium]